MSNELKIKDIDLFEIEKKFAEMLSDLSSFNFKDNLVTLQGLINENIVIVKDKYEANRLISKINDYVFDLKRDFFNFYKSLKNMIIGELSEDEKIILKNLANDYKYIARDYNGNLEVYANKPIKCCEYGCWDSSDLTCELKAFNDLFLFINFKDEKAYKISDLIGDEDE